MDKLALLPFVLTQIPDEWEDVPEYTTRFVSFTLYKHSREYKMVEFFFYGAPITQIQRIQNPFQFGRYVFRREMLKTTYEVSGKNTTNQYYLFILDECLKFQNQLKVPI